MTHTVKDRVIAILAEQAVMDVSDIRMEDTLQDLGLDSLGLVESIFAIEEALTSRFPSMRTSRASRNSTSLQSRRSSRRWNRWFHGSRLHEASRHYRGGHDQCACP